VILKADPFKPSNAFLLGWAFVMYKITGYSKSPYNSSSKPDPTFPYELFEKIYGPKEGELLPTSAAAAAATVVPITPAAPADASVDAKVAALEAQVAELKAIMHGKQ